MNLHIKYILVLVNETVYLIGSLCCFSVVICQSSLFGFGFEKHSKKTG